MDAWRAVESRRAVLVVELEDFSDGHRGRTWAGEEGRGFHAHVSVGPDRVPILLMLSCDGVSVSTFGVVCREMVRWRSRVSSHVRPPRRALYG